MEEFDSTVGGKNNGHVLNENVASIFGLATHHFWGQNFSREPDLYQ